MKRIWMLLALCLSLACASAVAENRLTATLTAGKSEFQIVAKMHSEEAWLYLPAFAQPEKMTLAWNGEPAFWEQATETEGIWQGMLVNAEGEELLPLYAMYSQNLPALFLFSDDPVQEGREYIESHPTHETSTKGAMAMVDADGAVNHAGRIRKLRGRGNGTWEKPKRPYQFRLEERQDLLNIGEAAHTWVLLAESTDGTLLHNRLALDLALELGQEENAHSEHVDLYYDGDYRGTYLLAEKVMVDRTGVDELDYDDLLESWNDRVGQHDLDALPQMEGQNRFGLTYRYIDGIVESSRPDAGAYLLELKNEQLIHPSRSCFYLSNGDCIESKNPKNATKTMMDYVSTRLEEALQTLRYGGVNPETGRTIEDDFDVDSFVYAALINELSYNIDGFVYGSSYFVLPAGETRFRAGPVWDFDLAWRYTYDHSNENGAGLKSYEGWLPAFYGTEFFMERMRQIYTDEVYPVVRNILLGTQQGQYLRSLDEYAEWIAASQRMNEQLWEVQLDWRLSFEVGFEDEIEALRSFVDERSQWLLETLQEVQIDPENIDLRCTAAYMRMKDKLTLEVYPWSRASLRNFTLEQISQATEDAYAVWQLEAVIDPAVNHTFVQPSVKVNGTPVQYEMLEDGGLRICLQLEDETYRPVDYYGEDIGMIYQYDAYIRNYPEIAEECEYDPEEVADYFYLEGMYDGQRGNGFFDPVELMKNHPELKKSLGDDYLYYYLDFCQNGWEQRWVNLIKRVYEPALHDMLAQ